MEPDGTNSESPGDELLQWKAQQEWKNRDPKETQEVNRGFKEMASNGKDQNESLTSWASDPWKGKRDRPLNRRAMTHRRWNPAGDVWRWPVQPEDSVGFWKRHGMKGQGGFFSSQWDPQERITLQGFRTPVSIEAGTLWEEPPWVKDFLMGWWHLDCTYG